LAEAHALEDDCVYAHLVGLDVLLAAQDHAAVRDSLAFLEAEARYDFGALEDPLWDAFRSAPESERWR